MTFIPDWKIADDGWPVLAVAGIVTILTSMIFLPLGCFFLGIMMWLAHGLRLPNRQTKADDQIIARYDLPVEARDLAKGHDGSPLVVVNKGDMLWRIAYHQLGEGVKYVDIVRRNKQDIADPDLIYPKQIFAVPQSSATASDKN